MTKTSAPPEKPSLLTQGDMTFVEHLEELRSRIIHSIIAISAGCVAVFLFRHQLLVFLEKPVGVLYYYSPPEAFLTHLKLALWGGLFIALPVILNQIWMFFSPALYKNEKRYFFSGLFFSFIFLIFALIFLYNYLPLIVQTCFRFANNLATPAISFSLYISFISKIIILFGITFEMPLAFYLFTKAGVITPHSLVKKHSYALLIILTISALLTPPDILSLLILCLPLIVLFEISILFSYLAYRGQTELAG